MIYRATLSVGSEVRCEGCMVNTVRPVVGRWLDLRKRSGAGWSVRKVRMSMSRKMTGARSRDVKGLPRIAYSLGRVGQSRTSRGWIRMELCLSRAGSAVTACRLRGDLGDVFGCCRMRCLLTILFISRCNGVHDLAPTSPYDRARLKVVVGVQLTGYQGGNCRELCTGTGRVLNMSDMSNIFHAAQL